MKRAHPTDGADRSMDEEFAALRTQAQVGRVAFALVGPLTALYLRVLRGNRLDGVEHARQVYRDVLAMGRPVVVCANHLTMVDSFFLHLALAPLTDYLADFRRLAWNVPAIENFQRNPFLRVLTYVGKTVPIDRAGDAAHHKRVLGKLRHLAEHGEVCAIFPEGGRSRTGRIETTEVKYGVGQILRELERPIVLCAYLRGDKQTTWGTLPAFGDTVRLSVEVLEPSTRETGLRASRDLASQVIHKLKSMEEAHFARHGDPAERGVPSSRDAS